MHQPLTAPKIRVAAGRAVVLGGYGLIGAACVRELKAAGFTVIGVGRSLKEGLRCDPSIKWLARDISRTSADAWARDLVDADVIVNASGALQNGARDNLHRIHEAALSELITALDGSSARFIQISAAGVSETASTEFLRSKMQGDRLLMASPLDWVILRPTLVISPQAFGGTALLRASAAFPLVGMKVLASSPIQTVSVEDVARAVVQTALGEIAPHTVADLTEVEVRTFATVTKMVRAWQGFPAWRMTLPVPAPVVQVLGLGADALGWLGWRSPFRTTALKALADGVTGNPAAWEAAGGLPCRSLDATLAGIPTTTQERWFARLFLLLPAAIATLALFWIASGMLGLAGQHEARGLLTDRGVPDTFAATAVIGGALVDILLGSAILVRRWSRTACFGMVAVSLAYLAGATLWAPDLWADPLGPLVKVLPSIMLSLVVAALLDER